MEDTNPMPTTDDAVRLPDSGWIHDRYMQEECTHRAPSILN